MIIVHAWERLLIDTNVVSGLHASLCSSMHRALFSSGMLPSWKPSHLRSETWLIVSGHDMLLVAWGNDRCYIARWRWVDRLLDASVLTDCGFDEVFRAAMAWRSKVLMPKRPKNMCPCGDTGCEL